MSFAQRLTALAVVLGTMSHSGTIATAAQTHAVGGPRHVLPIRVTRFGPVPGFRGTFVPALRPLVVRGPALPVGGLPGFVRPQPWGRLPALVPRFAFAALLWHPSDACSPPRRDVIVATLPQTPSWRSACVDAQAAAGDVSTALVPGRNKNALYGRAYTPGGVVIP